jgi:hypothetical protein
MESSVLTALYATASGTPQRRQIPAAGAWHKYHKNKFGRIETED